MIKMFINYISHMNRDGFPEGWPLNAGEGENIFGGEKFEGYVGELEDLTHILALVADVFYKTSDNVRFQGRRELSWTLDNYLKGNTRFDKQVIALLRERVIDKERGIQMLVDSAKEWLENHSTFVVIWTDPVLTNEDIEEEEKKSHKDLFQLLYQRMVENIKHAGDENEITCESLSDENSLNGFREYILKNKKRIIILDKITYPLGEIRQSEKNVRKVRKSIKNRILSSGICEEDNLKIHFNLVADPSKTRVSMNDIRMHDSVIILPPRRKEDDGDSDSEEFFE